VTLFLANFRPPTSRMWHLLIMSYNPPPHHLTWHFSFSKIQEDLIVWDSKNMLAYNEFAYKKTNDHCKLEDRFQKKRPFFNRKFADKKTAYNEGRLYSFIRLFVIEFCSINVTWHFGCPLNAPCFIWWPLHFWK